MATEPEAGTVTAQQAMMLLLVNEPAELKRLERAGAFRQIAPGRYRLVELVQGFVRHVRAADGAAVSLAALAKHFDCVPAYIRKLVDQGILERGSDGKFDKDKCRSAYLKHLRTERRLSPRGTTDAAFTAAKTELVQLRIAERAGHLVPAEQHAARCEEIVGTFLAALSSMPARVAIADRAARRRLEQWTYDLRTSIAKVMLAKADAEEAEDRNGKQSEVPPLRATERLGA